jgi:hypothetical protein
MCAVLHTFTALQIAQPPNRQMAKSLNRQSPLTFASAAEALGEGGDELVDVGGGDVERLGHHLEREDEADGDGHEEVDDHPHHRRHHLKAADGALE